MKNYHCPVCNFEFDLFILNMSSNLSNVKYCDCSKLNQIIKRFSLYNISNNVLALHNNNYYVVLYFAFNISIIH